MPLILHDFKKSFLPSKLKLHKKIEFTSSNFCMKLVWAQLMCSNAAPSTCCLEPTNLVQIPHRDSRVLQGSASSLLNRSSAPERYWTTRQNFYYSVSVALASPISWTGFRGNGDVRIIVSRSKRDCYLDYVVTISSWSQEQPPARTAFDACSNHAGRAFLSAWTLFPKIIHGERGLFCTHGQIIRRTSWRQRGRMHSNNGTTAGMASEYLPGQTERDLFLRFSQDVLGFP